MSDREKESEHQKAQEKDKTDDNSVNVCDPDSKFTEEQARDLQAELDRAKEDNSFSSTSRCVIT